MDHCLINMEESGRSPSICHKSNRCLRRNRQQRQRAQYRILGFLILVSGGAIFKDSDLKNRIGQIYPSNENSQKEFHILRNNPDQIQKRARRIETVIDNTSPCNSEKRLENKAYLTIYCAGVLYMFFAIAIVCDEFFVPALEEISSENHLDLSMDVAGATLMAAGGSAPELFTSLIGTFQGSEVGFGTIVGSAVFNVLFVIGMCAIFSKDTLTLTWWPLARDCVYYTIGLLTLAIFCGYSSPGKIEIWEALVLFALYIGYVILMKYNESLWSIIQKKTKGGQVADESKDEKDYALGPGKVHTFRVGLLNFIIGKGSLLDRVGIVMVTKISGDVDSVFKALDTSGDGYLDHTEFRELVETLGTSVEDEEITQALNDLDDNKDGKVRCKELSVEMVRKSLST
jgi:Ca2+/Na+ antiporter